MFMFLLAVVVFLIFHHAEIPLCYLHVIQCLIRLLYNYFLTHIRWSNLYHRASIETLLAGLES